VKIIKRKRKLLNLIYSTITALLLLSYAGLTVTFPAKQEIINLKNLNLNKTLLGINYKYVESNQKKNLLVSSVYAKNTEEISPSPTLAPPSPKYIQSITITSNTDSSKISTNITENIPATSSSSLDSDVLFNLVNQYRQKVGLAAFEKEEKLCSLASERSAEIYNEIFVTKNMHSGLHAKNLPYSITENIIYANTEETALNWWLNSYVHKQSIENNYKYSCIGCSGNSCSELFTSFIPK